VQAAQKETLYFTDFATRDWNGPGADFANVMPRSVEAFEAEFAVKPEATLRVEASTDNMSCPSAPETIARFATQADVADLRVVTLVRDPVDRIVSEYEHTLRLGWQTGSLMQSLQAEASRTSRGWHPLFRHIDRTRYASQIARFRNLLGDRLITLDFHRIGDIEEHTRLLRWIGRADVSDAEQMEHRNQRSVFAHPRRQALLRNEALKDLARTVAPKWLRPTIRRMVGGPPMERYKPSLEEIAFIREALADEIRACRDAPEIPTESWNWSRLTAA
jgi:hypothetical protein